MTAIRPPAPRATVPPANPSAILSRSQPTGASADTASQDGLAPGHSSFERPTSQRPSGTPPSGELLAQGARGPQVNSLQEQLNKAGANLQVDGVYGPATEQAVRHFQQRNNLPADGIVGDMTRRALEQAAPSAPQGLLTQGAAGPAVLQLQQQLNKTGASLQEDGSFGPTTERAVRDFQRQHNLPADGMVGPKTQQKLDEVVRSGGSQRPTQPNQGSNSPASGVASKLQPLVQQDATSCGLASVAMMANAAHANAGTGKAPIDDQDLRRENGGGTGYLPTVLNNHLQGTGLRATDEDWSSGSWDKIRQTLSAGNPVLLSTNGEFSASGYGHYIALTKMEGNRVQYADPADGQLKWTTTDILDAQPAHTDGRWYSRVVPE